MSNRITFIFTALLLSVATLAHAASLADIQFIKIAAKEEKAVIKAADGKLQVIKPGDAVVEGVKVKEIASGRIVLEEKTDKGPETVIVRMVNNKATIERVKKTPDKKPALVAPAAQNKD